MNKKNFWKITLKKKKLFLITIRYILKNCISAYFYYLRCYGYRFVIWGKIGVSGNSKTRNFIAKNKIHTLTTKNYKVQHEFVTLNTFTGVLGLSFYLIF